MSTQFPASGEQPGFRNVETAVEADNAKAPNHVVFPTLLIYVLTELQKGLDARNQDLIDRSVLLPDGRHAYINPDGTFWIFPSDEGKGGAKYKLEANLQPLARRLAECMKTGGITDGRRAQTACLERVAGVRPASTDPAAAAQNKADLRRLCGEIVLSNGRRVLHVEQGESFDEAMKKFQECIGPNGTEPTSPAPPTAPAAVPPPAAEPASPPASPADDDPIRAGGFITPPDQGYVVLCVQSGLIQLYPDSWNTPDIGGKMVTFQNFISPYILSVAKPSWLYGIGDQAYARFNPAATRDPASFVFPIPPGQQTTPGSCPADYSPFWLWRKPLKITIPQ